MFLCVSSRFDTGVGGLVLEDQFLQLSTRLCSQNVYGLGENVHRTLKRDLWYDTYPLFGRDQPTVAADALKVSWCHPCAENEINVPIALGVFRYNKSFLWYP